jgi:L-rhamnose mutarotase
MRLQSPPSSLSHPYNAWVVYCDVYALNLVIKEQREEAALRLIRTAHQNIRELLFDSGIRYSSLHLQDSLFLVFPDEPDPDIDEPNEPVRFAQERRQQQWQELVARVLAIFAEHELILRGGAAYGQVATDSSTVLGQPVYRAIEYEKLVGVPVVLLPCKEYSRMFDPQADVSSMKQIDQFAPPFQIVPTRNGGEILAVPILPAPRDAFERIVARRLLESRFEGHGPSVMFWNEAARLLHKTFHDP